MGHTYRGGKSGRKMVTLFDSYCYDGVSAGLWVIPSGAKYHCSMTACGMISFGGLLSK